MMPMYAVGGWKAALCFGTLFGDNSTGMLLLLSLAAGSRLHISLQVPGQVLPLPRKWDVLIVARTGLIFAIVWRGYG